MQSQVNSPRTALGRRFPRWSVTRSVLILFSLLAASSASAQTLRVLASFNFSGSGGADPSGSLTLIGNALYGMTNVGGADNDGTVFSVPVSGGSPSVLATFNGSNGSGPVSNLTLIGNALYGTTGRNGGTVFSVPVSGGSPKVLASFNGNNGSGPYGNLTLIGNALYGTTVYGGLYGDGVVFSLPVSGGSPTVLASFSGSNGELPVGGLTLGSSTLYGMASEGGDFSLNNGHGAGVVFSVPVSGGAPTVLATFNDSDGNGPKGNLTLIGNNLYGVTVGGGDLSVDFGTGDGVVFSLPVSGGSPTVLASFNGNNGSDPGGSLTLVGNTLYGTAVGGGFYGDGVVFGVPVGGGAPTVLASFNGSNGDGPGGDLTLSGNTLYGVAGGGPYGAGTVFALTLPSAWASAASGNWSNSGNWTGGVPNGSGDGAVFNVSTTAAVTVTLNLPVTLGSLQFGNSSSPSVGYTLSGSGSNTLSLNNSGNGATITVTDGSHAINAPVILAENLIVTTGGTNAWTLSFGTASSITDDGNGYSLTMSGTGGTLILSGSDNYTGGTFVEDGTLIATNAEALRDGSSLTVGGETSLFAPLAPAAATAGAGANELSPVPEPGALALLAAALVVGAARLLRNPLARPHAAIGNV